MRRIIALTFAVLGIAVAAPAVSSAATPHAVCSTSVSCL